MTNRTGRPPEQPARWLNWRSRLLEQDQWLEAEPVLRECLAIREKAQPNDWATFNTQSMLGASLIGQGRYAEAEPLVLSGYQAMKAREARIPFPARTRLSAAAVRVIKLYEYWGKNDMATRWRAQLTLNCLAAKPSIP